MAFKVFLLLLLEWLARSQGARVGQEEKVPWKRAVAVGTILGSKLAAAHSVDALPEKESNLATKVDAMQDTDAGSSYKIGFEHQKDMLNKAERVLVNILRKYELEDEAVVKKLISNLRSGKRLDEKVIESLGAIGRVRGSNDQSPSIFIASADSSEVGVVQQMFVPMGDGGQGVVVMHYLKHYHDLGLTPSVQQMLRGLEISGTLEDGLFLRCVALSHSSREFGQDLRSEFMVMLEPTVGPLDEVFQTTPVHYSHRLEMFLRLLEIVQRLRELDIPHSSDIDPSNVFVQGDTNDFDSLTLVLSPDLLAPSSKMSAIDRLDADIQKLGAILRWMFQIDWPGEARQRNEVVLALGKAMEAGALTDGLAAVKEFREVMGLVLSGEPSQDDLISARMKYLHLAMSAAKHSEEGPQEVKVSVSV